METNPISFVVWIYDEIVYRMEGWKIATQFLTMFKGFVPGHVFDEVLETRLRYDHQGFITIGVVDTVLNIDRGGLFVVQVREDVKQSESANAFIVLVDFLRDVAGFFKGGVVSVPSFMTAVFFAFSCFSRCFTLSLEAFVLCGFVLISDVACVLLFWGAAFRVVNHLNLIHRLRQISIIED